MQGYNVTFELIGQTFMFAEDERDLKDRIDRAVGRMPAFSVLSVKLRDVETEDEAPEGGFPERLAHLRKKANVYQAELADLLDLSQNSVSQYERGTRKPEIETIIKLSSIFKVPTDYLLGVSNKKVKEG